MTGENPWSHLDDVDEFARFSLGDDRSEHRAKHKTTIDANGRDHEPSADFDDRAPPHGCDADDDGGPQPNGRTAQPNGGLWTITVVAGERHIAADQELQALVDAKAPFYQRNTKIVRTALVKAKDSNGKIFLVSGIVPVTLAILERVLGQCASRSRRHWGWRP